jgi:hypothetical protein
MQGPGWVEQSRLSLQTDPGTSEPGAELNPYPPVPAFMAVHFIAHGPDGSHGTGDRSRTPDNSARAGNRTDPSSVQGS